MNIAVKGLVVKNTSCIPLKQGETIHNSIEKGQEMNEQGKEGKNQMPAVPEMLLNLSRTKNCKLAQCSDLYHHFSSKN